jgi:predicted nucleic acid-binding protein
VSVLVDTNVLLRSAQPAHADHRLALDSLARLRTAGQALHVTPQNIAEAWRAMTAPPGPANGLGFTVEQAHSEVERIERLFALLPEIPAIYEAWKRIVVRYGVIGLSVFDARLVAAMEVHGIGRILTFNTADFAPYGIEALHPSTPLGGA